MSTKKLSKKDIAIMVTLSVICLGIACAAFFLNKKLEETFTPAAASEATSSNVSADNPATAQSSEVPETTAPEAETTKEANEIIPETEAIIEKETASRPRTKEEAQKASPAPSEPVTHYMENPESCTKENSVTESSAAPAAPSTAPALEATPETQPPATDASTEGKAYDPVFGWVDTTTPQQEITDNTGDLHKQVGTMN